jgi:hypothetical protein
MRGWPLADVLNAIDGIAYVVDSRYHIIAIGAARWDAFAEANGAPELAGGAILGRNLLDLIQGDEVRDLYRRLLELAVSSEAPVSIAARCDSPDIRRELRLTLSPLQQAGSMRGILFQSLAVNERIRPPIDLYDFKAVMTAVKGRTHLPIVTICSFCQLVSVDGTTWLEAEEYYRWGGSSDVRISHGVCPACDARHYGGTDAED